MVGAAHRHQDRHRVAARQHLPGRPDPGRPRGRAGLRPVRPHRHRGPLPRPALRHRRPRSASAATPTPKPDPNTPTPPPRRPGIDYLRLIDTAHDAQLARAGQLRRPHRQPPTGARTDTSRAGRSTVSHVDDRRHRRARTPRDHRASASPLRVHPHAVRPRPRPRHAAPPPAHNEAVARITWCVTEHRPRRHHRRGRRRQDRRRPRRPGRPRPDPAHHHLPRQPHHRRPRHPPRHRHRARAASPIHTRPPSSRRPPTPSPSNTPNAAAPPSSSSTRPTCSTTPNSKASACSPTTTWTADHPFACLLVGQPTLRRRIKLGVLAALDQRIALRYALPPHDRRRNRRLRQTPPRPGRPLRHPVLRRRHRTDPPDQPRPTPARSTTSPSKPSSPRSPPTKPSSTSPPPAPPSPRSRQNDQLTTHGVLPTKAPHRRPGPVRQPADGASSSRRRLHRLLLQP